MKKYSSMIFICLFFMSILEANELSWVDEQIKAIKPPRKGATNYDISKVRSPFVFLYKKKKPKSDVSKKSIKKNSISSSKGVKIQKNTFSKTSSVRLSLSAIINGSALINGRWYKLEEKVYGYTVAGIKLTSVLLVNGDKKLILSTTDTKRNLKFK